MAAWIATSLRNLMPHCELDWAIETRCQAVVNTSTLCSHLIEVPRELWKTRGLGKSLLPQLRFFLGLRHRNYDYGIDLQGHSKTAIFLRFARPKLRVSVAATDAFAALLNPVASGIEPKAHFIEQWFQVVSRTFEIGLPERPIMPTFSTLPARSRPRATIAVGAGQPEKSYPIESWEKVGAQLLDNGVDVEFLGGPTDCCPAVQGSQDSVGKLTLRDTMARIANSDVTLCADTGAGHIAAAFGVPVVSIFGPTLPARSRPYTKNGVVLHRGDSPRDVSPDEVIAAARRLLGRTVSR